MPWETLINGRWSQQKSDGAPLRLRLATVGRPKREPMATSSLAGAYPLPALLRFPAPLDGRMELNLEEMNPEHALAADGRAVRSPISSRGR